jgi:uncharacterized membrane protein
VIVIVSKTALVVLAGVYAMRASGVLFHPQPFQPLMVVALLAFIMSVVLFQNPPTVAGWWLYTVIGLCCVGVAANAVLFFAPDAAHNTPTNLTFSAVSIVGWAIVALANVSVAFGRGPTGA